MTTEFPPFPNGSSFDAKFDGPISDLKANTTDLNAAKGTEQKEAVIDAGLRSLDHYKRALPKWRYDLRQQALPLIRWETPYLAWLQAKLRSPALDSYFAITANLGTHTFFMIGLPIMFWCGFASFGKGLVHILASGVFFTGFIKDFFSLPRPLSPPLQRITMSGSAALEYGFPSTHSANAVSVAVYAILCLRSPDNTFQPNTKLALESLSYFYAVSIVLGRLYCGMHGFVDVVIGSIMGALITLIEFYYGPPLDFYFQQNDWTMMFAAVLAIIVLVRVHPEPADDCPCFDDSVCFAGVMIGLEVGTWHFGQSPFATIPFDLHALGWPAVILRVLFGVFVVFIWREVAKPTLLKTLPHLFRLIETWGLSLPRRFFMPASEYKNIPLRLKVDNVLPSVSDLPNLITAVRHPRRGRSVSIGPQSAADAYETLAYRERRRKESNASLRSKVSMQELKSDQVGHSTAVNGQQKPSDFEKQMGEGTVIVSPTNSKKANGEPEMYIGNQDELSDKEVFSKLVRPRVRYDVEVITKLVVYAGIAWFAVEGVPILFEYIPGLGAGHLQLR
ncbi:PAP2-domain-containing protein [Xylaria bambusicola]|uniref:PAP2-domain-containing protein n=1 Tax=Xylaria bambusicola TaxID=326684 RepID=UPI0020077D87|nr:PAP2-domain-containing protein [Xylaria bambusicola]KAI0518152.1 PAP2-domain-containing protein [Xylaria bambusicola]